MDDYRLVLRDASGRECVLYITGADDDTREAVEANAFQNAVARGLIGEDAWLVERER